MTPLPPSPEGPLLQGLRASWPARAERRVGPVTVRDGAGGGARVSAATLAGPASAEMLVAARTIPASQIISAADLDLRGTSASGALSDPAEVIGMEARVALYPGRPIRAGDIGPPAVVERNQIITLVYRGGGLTITTEGRALERAGPGDMIRVMNLASRSTITATISEDGAGHVSH